MPSTPTNTRATFSDPGQQQDAVRATLQARSRELGARIRAAKAERSDALEHGAQDTVQDAGDQGEQRTRELMLTAEEERDAVELTDIEAALQRLDEGSYGECVDCGVAITHARLQVQPAAARCIDCQQRFEKAQAHQGPVASA